MILRQTYLDPIRNRMEIKEIELRLEDVRMPGEAHPRIRILGFCNDMVSMAEPIEQIHYILDSKRSYCPPAIPATRVIAYIEEKNQIVCYDNSHNGLDANPGDPIAVLTSARDVKYGVVTDVDEKVINVTFGVEVKVRVGSILQNLRNLAFSPSTHIGLTSRMAQPEGLGLVSHVARGSLMVMVTAPLNPGQIKYFDVYVRNRPIDIIEPFWWPDIYDQNIHDEQVTITTFNGGKEAGGGDLMPGQSYWLTAVAKTRKGFTNTNESPVQFVETVKIPD